MSLEIDAKINQLPEEKRKEFSEELFHVSQDRDWFSEHGIGKTYAKPNMEQVKGILFNESYAKYVPA